MEKIKAKNKTTKLISAILIISIMAPSVLFSFPTKTIAFWGIFDFGVDTDPLNAGINTENAAVSTENASVNTSSLGLKIKDVAKEILRQVARAIVRRALQEMTKSTINWINSGFHGQPLFLENPDSFFKDIAKSELKNMVDQFGYDSLKYPFGKDFALNAINSYKQTLENNTAYSLSKITNDPVLLRSYQNDFNVGGWNGFLINTQYPQNNYLGFQMVATEELARRVQGTSQNGAQKVQGLLQQGQGFLSPQVCATNPGYDHSEWSKPSFDMNQYIKDNPRPSIYDTAASAKWLSDLDKHRIEWSKTNSCPPKADGSSGYVNTTPGSVVASKIMGAVNMPETQAGYSQMVGDSMSAIFDALLNKFIDDGLNSLASKSNPKNDPDTWSYDGQTLGSPADGGYNSTWDTGPGEPIYINSFKKAIEDGITNTETEIMLISQISDNLGIIWPKTRTLDICLPGPDLGWERRLEEEKNKADNRIQGASSGGSESKMEEGDRAMKELKFAVDLFKDWITNQMIVELPSSILYMDAVKEVEDLSQESKELNDAKKTKAQGLARLKSIQNALDGILELDSEGNAIQPEIGSFEEEILIQLKKQYDATRVSISNNNSVDSRQDELLVTEEKLKNLDDLTAMCEEERIEKGWSNPTGLAINPEQALFCDLPIIGGYTHGVFQGLSLTHPELPMVNARKVMKYKVITIGSVLGGAFSGDPSKTAWVNINLKCNNIYNATILDYKGNLPGPTSLTDTAPAPDIGGNSQTGTCEFEDGLEEEVTQEYCEENGGSWTQNEEVTP